MPANVKATFLAALSKITGTGNFHTEGTEAFFLPKIEVEGVGELAFPLPEVQAKALIGVAEAAPYGRGTETARNDAVRKCWQIDAKSLQLDAKPWRRFLKKAVDQVRTDLGIASPVSAVPYKLLVYEKGGHFLPHRDTEKLDAMFGTLIIALPSAHKGGALQIRHDGREVTLHFDADPSWRDFQFAALFADCEHEVKPVRSGYRCCLVYNLRLDRGDPNLLHLPLTAQANSLLPSLGALAKQGQGLLGATLLEHSYTEANFSLRHLKGNDQARARALLAAAEELNLMPHLGLVTYHQSGELVENTNRYASRRRRRYYDPESDHDHDASEDDGSMGEIFEESLTLGQWRDARDRPVALGTYHVDKNDLCASESLGEGKPDEKESEGYTGNEGCTMDYWYRRATVVWWAKEDHERVLCHYNLSGACRELLDLAGKRGKAKQAAFQRLASAVIEKFPESLPTVPLFARESGRRFTRTFDSLRNLRGDAQPLFCQTLAALARARSEDGLARLLSRVEPDAITLCHSPLWKDLFAAFGTAPFEPVLDRLLQEDPDAHRDVFFRVLDALPPGAADADVTRKLLSAVVRLSPRPAPIAWQRTREPQPPGDADEIRTVLLASHRITDKTERACALAFLRGDESLRYLRTLLGPILTEKPIRAAGKKKGSLFPEAMSVARETLGAEVARELVPYPDWTRPCPVSPKKSAPSNGRLSDSVSPRGRLIEELARFMANPEEPSHEFKRAQGDRKHIEDFIQHHFLDLDQTTIRQGTPHTLRLTKNDTSYQHALVVRKSDKQLLAKLLAVP